MAHYIKSTSEVGLIGCPNEYCYGLGNSPGFLQDMCETLSHSLIQSTVLGLSLSLSELLVGGKVREDKTVTGSRLHVRATDVCFAF